MNPAPSLLSIVLSLRNEAIVLPELLKRLQRTLNTQGFSYELIFVNDASTDETAVLLDRYAGEFREVKVLHLSRRFGVQPSIWAGIQHAAGEVVIMMDADLQDPPELIPEMIKKWQEGAEIIHTVRSSREGEPPVKMLLTRWAYQAISCLSNQSFQVDAGDFKLLSRRAVQELLKHSDQMPYIRGLVASLGLSQASIAYRREKRGAGSSHFSLLGRGPVETFLTGIVSFSPFPLYAIFAAGLCLTCVSLLGFLISSVTAQGSFIWGVSLICLLLSFNLTAIGVAGLYLWFTFKQVQKHPLYIVDRKVNFK